MAEQARAMTVWFDTDRTRYFLVPDDIEVTPGGLFLRSARGGHKTVDLDAVATFEVTKEEAVGRMKEELEQTARRVKDSVSELFQGSKGEGARADGERVMRGLGRVFGSALSVISETLTNPAAAEEVKARTEQLREGVTQEAEKVEPAVQAFSEKIKEIFNSPEVTGALDNLGKGLQDLAQKMQQKAATEAAAPAAEPAPAEEAAPAEPTPSDDPPQTT